MHLEKNKIQFLFICVVIIIPVASAGIACLANPCSHGICIDDINSTYACYCIDGYTGVQCQTNWDECWSNPCQNGGSCIDGVATYNCTCPEGFIGENCETNFNECDSNPCLNNGTCIDMTNEFICRCVPGFSGDHCELDAAVCNSTEEVRCYNGAECIEGPGYKFYCKCSAGWTGSKCEDQIDECQSDPCRNGGICIDIHADYMCACAYGFTGKSCEVQIEFCDEYSCSKNALCVVEDGVRVCYCVPDYHGERCELQYDECLLGPACMNGGTCIDGVDNSTCSCPPKLTGSLCECLILDDGSYDCEYMPPTSPPVYNETVSTTVISTETIAYKTVTNDITKYNATTDIVTISMTITEYPIWMNISDFTTTSDLPFITTDTSLNTKTTTSIESTTPEDTTEAILTEQTKVTTDLTIGIVTSIIETQKTPEIDDSKTESTTECRGVCTEQTISTPSSAFTVSTEDSKAITETETTLATKDDITSHITNITTEATSTDTTTTNIVETTIMDISIKSTTETAESSRTETSHTDVTTDLMFTDTPKDTTEHTYFTTSNEITEPSTEGDETTQVPSTPRSDCTDFVCHNHGTCVNGLHAVRCHCLFNYGGTFCEEKITVTSAAFNGFSFITHHVKSSSTIAIKFNAKTLITDGQIMYVDITKGAYMKLYMCSGLLKFEFSCGYQTMLLSELKTYVNKGYLMNIETRLDVYLKEKYCNATLRLNDTLAMSGGQVAGAASSDRRTVVAFGNTPYTNSSDKPFIGCIHDLIVNGEKREIFGDAYDADVTECSSLSCLSSPCSNGGTCGDHGDSFTCSCANGWMGSSCNQSVCEHNPCQYGGSCVRHPGSGFLCLCPYGKHGIFCEYNVEITRPAFAPVTSGLSSYLMYPLSPAAINSDKFDLRLRFHTPDMEQISLLMFVGQSGQHDTTSQHIALTYVKGYIMLTWNMGSGPRRIFTARAVGAGAHVARVWRRGRSAGLSVDGRHNVSGNAPPRRRNMTLLPFIYIGGHPSPGLRALPHDLPLHGGWRGCVWEVWGAAAAGGAGVAGEGRALAGRGVGQCGVAHCSATSCNAPRGVCIHSPATYGCICNEGWFGATCSSTQSPCDSSQSQCKGACVMTLEDAGCDCPYGKSGAHCDQDLIPIDVMFKGTRSYIKLYSRIISSASLALEAEIKPTKERGILMFIETPHFHTTLSLQGGLLEYRWTDAASGVSTVARAAVVAAARRWQRVRAGSYAGRLYVWVGGALASTRLRAHALPHTASAATLTLGGAKDLASLPFDVMSGPPESYGGCLRNLYINNVFVPLAQQNIEEGQNIGACGAACGDGDGSGDGSGGGGGGGGGAAAGEGGARCRRAACRAPLCAGRCVRGRCVCAAGTAGENCDQPITVTTPQFDGAALLTLTRSQSGRRQRLASAPARPYVAFTFTTPDPNGLLLWIKMGIDYLGLGLENGYLKLVWSLHCNGSSLKTRGDQTPPHVMSALVRAGFVADGDWHAVELHMDTRITFGVDNKTHVEGQCLNGYEYEDVDLYLGGVVDEEKAAEIFPQNFKGCIDKVSTIRDTYVTNYSEVYSENVRSCQLFPPAF